MELRQRWRRWREEWKKHRVEEACLRDLHTSLLKTLCDRFLPLGGTALTIPARVDATTLDLWRRNAQDAALSDTARQVAAIFAEIRQGSGTEMMDYVFLLPLDGTFLSEVRLPRGTVYFRFRE